MYRQLPDQDHHLCTQPIAPYQQPVTDTFVDINLNLLPASKDTLRQHTACDTNVRPDSTPTYGSVEIAHQSTCRKYLKYVEARSSTTATHKRKTERQMKHVLFGEGTECRRFSADLSRWSTKSAEHPLRKSQPCCCSCQPCPIHLAPTNGTIIQPLDVSSCNAALAISFASNNIGYGGEVGDPSTNQSGTSIEHDQVETVQLLFFQVFIPFLVAGFGNVAVGLLLAHVQHWPVFRQLNGLMMLTSAFLGFKGNLEMSLAARLSTKANCGHMDQPKQQWQIGYSNVALVQVQSVAVALMVALVSAVGTVASHHRLRWQSVQQLLATSLSSASASSLCLATLMVIVVLLARKCRVNPDNVSTLIAACLGDVTAVGLIAMTSTVFFERPEYTLPVIASVLCLLLPFAALVASYSPNTNRALCTGWMPLILALSISSLSGFVFARCERIFHYIAIFQPILNGTGSNLIAVQVSRISTYLHQRSKRRLLPAEQLGSSIKTMQTEPHMFTVNGATASDPTLRKLTTNEWLKHCLLRPHFAFVGSNPNVRTARLLLLMVIPAHLTYLTIIWLLKPQLHFTALFVAAYVMVALLQVSLLLFISHVVVPSLWLCGVDPDTSAIPVMMSCADLLGTCLLGITFHLLHILHQPNADFKQ